MDWKEKADLYLTNVDSLLVQARSTHMSDGVVLSEGDRPLVRAFAISDPGFKQDAELTYVRGRDLFSSFQKAHITAECYWRLPNAKNESDLFGSSSPFLLESIVSLRSSKLSVDHIPFLLDLPSLIEDASSNPESTQCLVTEENGFTWCVMSHPDDANEVAIHTGEKGIQVAIDVPWMERGVIRRIRLLLACWPSPPQHEEIEKVATQFAESEIPLTT